MKNKGVLLFVMIIMIVSSIYIIPSTAMPTINNNRLTLNEFNISFPNGVEYDFNGAYQSGVGNVLTYPVYVNISGAQAYFISGHVYSGNTSRFNLYLYYVYNQTEINLTQKYGIAIPFLNYMRSWMYYEYQTNVVYGWGTTGSSSNTTAYFSIWQIDLNNFTFVYHRTTPLPTETLAEHNDMQIMDLTNKVYLLLEAEHYGTGTGYLYGIYNNTAYATENGIPNIMVTQQQAWILSLRDYVIAGGTSTSIATTLYIWHFNSSYNKFPSVISIPLFTLHFANFDGSVYYPAYNKLYFDYSYNDSGGAESIIIGINFNSSGIYQSWFHWSSNYFFLYNDYTYFTNNYAIMYNFSTSATTVSSSNSFFMNLTNNQTLYWGNSFSTAGNRENSASFTGLGYEVDQAFFSLRAYNYLYWISFNSSITVSANGSTYVNFYQPLSVYTYGSFNPPLTKTYNININESGLPSGTSWSFVFNGTTTNLNTNQYNLSEKNGSYSFSVSSINGYTVSYPSLINVNGNSQTVNVVFHKIATYKVELLESGLPLGAQWNYTFNSNRQVLGNNSYNYSLSNGTYSLFVNSVAGYTVNYPSSVIVNGHNEIIYINYSLIPSYTVYVKETGLNSGIKWHIYLNSNEYSSSSNYNNITNVYNGTYSFSVNNVNGYLLSSYPTSITINGNNYYINITFSKNTTLYSVSFIAHNVENINSIIWQITFNNTIYKSSNSNTIIIPSLKNGSYTFTVSNINGYILNKYSNSITINGLNQTINLYFNKTYSIFIAEKGYSSEWFIILNGTSHHSFNNNLNITGLVNYSYSFDVVLPTGYNVNSYDKVIVINGNNVYINLTFNYISIKQGYYSIEFIVSGLAKGNNFTIIINNQQYISTNNMYLNITLPNGTYTVFIELPNNYVLSQQANNLVVNGNNTVYAIYTNYQFNIWVYTPEFIIAIIFIGLVILGAYLKRAI